MKELTGLRLSDEDLMRWRAAYAREKALGLNPRAYSASESEAIMLAAFRLSGEIVANYGLDDTRNWKASEYSGLIWYEDA